MNERELVFQYGDGVLEAPDYVGVDTPPFPGSEHEEVETMALGAQFSELLAGQLAQSGNIAQNNFITVSKAQDYDYFENKRMVTLDEAVGIREVQSQVNPAGPGPRV